MRHKNNGLHTCAGTRQNLDSGYGKPTQYCELQEGVAEHNETFGVFEDLNVDDPRWHKAGDIRLALFASVHSCCSFSEVVGCHSSLQAVCMFRCCGPHGWAVVPAIRDHSVIPEFSNSSGFEQRNPDRHVTPRTISAAYVCAVLIPFEFSCKSPATMLSSSVEQIPSRTDPLLALSTQAVANLQLAQACHCQ